MAQPKPRRSRNSKPEPSLRARALRILARREYSRQELARKLAPITENPGEIPELLDDLERRGWLSESRVVEQVLASRRRRFGTQRIAHELREKGVSDAAIAGAQRQLKDSELDAAREQPQRPRTQWHIRFDFGGSHAAEPFGRAPAYVRRARTGRPRN